MDCFIFIITHTKITVLDFLKMKPVLLKKQRKEKVLLLRTPGTKKTRFCCTWNKNKSKRVFLKLPLWLKLKL